MGYTSIKLHIESPIKTRYQIIRYTFENMQDVLFASIYYYHVLVYTQYPKCKLFQVCLLLVLIILHSFICVFLLV